MLVTGEAFALDQRYDISAWDCRPTTESTATGLDLTPRNR
jgi:hypothetical protein